MRTVVFRADASLAIGTGHIVRCLTLADLLAKAGIHCVFVSRQHEGHVLDLVASRGHQVVSLPSGSKSTWLGVEQSRDAEETRRELRIRNLRPDWLVVDHYGIDVEWEAAVSGECQNLMVIDDLFDRRHQCDILFNQSSLKGIDQYRDLVAPTTKILIGPHYALLRPQFVSARTMYPRIVGPVKSVLVFFGGIDALDLTSRTLKALQAEVAHLDRIDVVVGLRYPHRERLTALAAQMARVRLHVQLEDPAPSMALADLAFGAGGSTIWERACLGLPSVVVGVAENQYALCEHMAERGYFRYLGAADTATEAVLRAAFAELGSTRIRESMAAKSAALVDGRGAMRIAAEMFADIAISA